MGTFLAMKAAVGATLQGKAGGAFHNWCRA